MKKLIALETNETTQVGKDIPRGVSQHLYVIDTEAEIKEGNYFIGGVNNTAIFTSKKDYTLENLKDEICATYGGNIHTISKVIATTNPSLNLPIISNIEECLDLVGQKVYVEIIRNIVSEEEKVTLNGAKYLDCEYVLEKERDFNLR